MGIETHLMELKHSYWRSGLGPPAPIINGDHLRNNRKQPGKVEEDKTSLQDLRNDFRPKCLFSNFDIHFSFILSRILLFYFH
jgi:hypothetical protein